MWVNEIIVDDRSYPCRDWSDVNGLLNMLSDGRILSLNVGRDIGKRNSAAILVNTDGEGHYYVTAYIGETPWYLINPGGGKGGRVAMNIGQQTTHIDERMVVGLSTMRQAIYVFCENGQLEPQLKWSSEPPDMSE